MPDGKEEEDATLAVLKALINITRVEEMPRGLDNFNLFRRLSVAFDKAEKTDSLVLEDNDYYLLKKVADKNIPSVWALNEKISEALELFINAKDEEIN